MLAVILALLSPIAMAAESEPPVAKPDAVVEIFSLSLPEGWTRNEDLSARTAANVQKAEHFGGDVVYRGNADSFVPREGLVLHVSWAGALEPVEEPAEVIRGELDRMKQMWCGDGERERIDWRVSTEDGLGDARLEWSHGGFETVTLSRNLVYAAGGRPRLVSAECVMRDDLLDELRPLCDEILQTLALTVETPDDLEIPPSNVGDGCPGDAPESAGDGRGDDDSAGPTIGEAPEGAGRGGVIYTGEGDSESDGGTNRLLMIGGAILLIIAIYLTTRSRRSEGEDEGESEGEDESESEGEGEDEGEGEGESDDEGEGESVSEDEGDDESEEKKS